MNHRWKAPDEPRTQSACKGTGWCYVIKRNAKSVDFDRELGAKVRAIRLSAGMNQAALGKAIGVSFQQLQKYETGKDRIAAGTLQKLGEVLGTHPGEFFDQAAASVGGVASCGKP